VLQFAIAVDQCRVVNVGSCRGVASVASVASMLQFAGTADNDLSMLMYVTYMRMCVHVHVCVYIIHFCTCEYTSACVQVCLHVCGCQLLCTNVRVVYISAVVCTVYTYQLSCSNI